MRIIPTNPSHLHAHATSDSRTSNERETNTNNATARSNWEERNHLHPSESSHNQLRRQRKMKRTKSNASNDSKQSNSREKLTKEQVLQLIQRNALEFNRFSEELSRSKGFIIRAMGSDGNCLFRSVADQIFGDQDMHDQVRERCVQYMKAERDHFSQFVTEDFEDYLQRKRQDRCYGNHLEIQAIGEMYNRPVEIYTYKDGILIEPINIFHGQYVSNSENPPIRLSYHNGNHYNSVIDPQNPSIGVGLGLPGLELGVADKSQVEKAISQSEESSIEMEILKQTQSVSEMENAERQMEEVVLNESKQEMDDEELDPNWQIEQAILIESQKEYLESLYNNNRSTDTREDQSNSLLKKEEGKS